MNCALKSPSCPSKPCMDQNFSFSLNVQRTRQSVNRAAFICAAPGTKRHILLSERYKHTTFHHDLKGWKGLAEVRLNSAMPSFYRGKINCFLFLPVIDWDKTWNSCRFSISLVFECLKNRVVWFIFCQEESA